MKKIKLLSLLFISLVWLSCQKDDAASSDCKQCAPAYSATDIQATVATAHVGKYSGLTLQYAKAGSPYPDGTKGDFELTASGQLIVKVNGNTCLTLSNPTKFSAQANKTYLFKDNCETNLTYEISFTNTDQLNEVNVGSLTGTFYGQFR